MGRRVEELEAEIRHLGLKHADELSQLRHNQNRSIFVRVRSTHLHLTITLYMATQLH